MRILKQMHDRFKWFSLTFAIMFTMSPCQAAVVMYSRCICEIHWPDLDPVSLGLCGRKQTPGGTCRISILYRTCDHGLAIVYSVSMLTVAFNKTPGADALDLWNEPAAFLTTSEKAEYDTFLLRLKAEYDTF